MSLPHPRALLWMFAIPLVAGGVAIAMFSDDARQRISAAATGERPYAAAGFTTATGEGAIADPATLRTTSLGSTLGFTGPEGSHAWLGLPYAQAPVGGLRWRAPRPPAAWHGVRPALQPSPICSQPGRTQGTGSAAEEVISIGSEDCLYLNIHAPAGAPATQSAGLPVMVWIHGGANLRGSGAEYDGSVLAVRQNVVVVTFNYRLGVLGWFSHPALRARAETPEDASGNYGTLDQIRALQWVKAHIAHFGGDPDRVTIFGESAGGQNVLALLTSPLADGLFQRAIIQSGTTQTVGFAAAEHARDAAEPGLPLSSEHLLRELLRTAAAQKGEGAARDSARPEPEAIPDFLRSRSVAELQAAITAVSTRHRHTQALLALPALIRDGHVIPGDGMTAALAGGRYHRVPVMIGSTRDEFTILLPMFAGPGRPVEVDPHTASLRIPDHRRYYRVADYLSRLMKAAMVDEPARSMHATRSHPLFVYRFDWDRLSPATWLDGIRFGATHGLDVPFVFGHRRLGPEYVQLPLIAASSEEDFDRMSAAMMSWWAQFAATGDPGTGRAGELPHWQRWKESEAGPERFMVLNAPERGGLRMSSATLTPTDVLHRLEQQTRAMDHREACQLRADLAAMSRPMGLRLDMGHPSCQRPDQ